MSSQTKHLTILCFSDPAEALRQERKRKAEEKQQEFLKMQEKRKTAEDFKVFGYKLYRILMSLQTSHLPPARGE